MRRFLPFFGAIVFASCNTEDIKPKDLKGRWNFVSGTYANICVNGETTYSGPGSCFNNSGVMSPYHMEISKDEIVRINGGDPTLRTTATYTVNGKVITGVYKNGGDTFTITVKELTDDKLSIHEEYIQKYTNKRHTLDATFKH